MFLHAPASPARPLNFVRLHLASAESGEHVPGRDPVLGPRTQPRSSADLQGPSGLGRAGPVGRRAGGRAWLCQGSF